MAGGLVQGKVALMLSHDHHQNLPAPQWHNGTRLENLHRETSALRNKTADMKLARRFMHCMSILFLYKTLAKTKLFFSFFLFIRSKSL